MAPWLPKGGPRGHTIFQWGPGEAFLVQRWEMPVDAAPDGVAILAVDEESGDLVQHYFDSRGVVRRYATSIEDGVWSLRKLTPGFAQRFLGQLSADGEHDRGRLGEDRGRLLGLGARLRPDLPPRQLESSARSRSLA